MKHNKKMKSRRGVILILFMSLCFLVRSQSSIPHLRKQGTATQLMVDYKPYLVLGDELHNSSSSNLEYMDRVLKKFSSIHLNTALAAVCRDLIEPEEGRFDFPLVDGAIQSARSNKLKLIFFL